MGLSTDWQLGLRTRILEVLVLRAGEATDPRLKHLDDVHRDKLLEQIRAVRTAEELDAARAAAKPYLLPDVELSRRSKVPDPQVGNILRGTTKKNLALGTVLAIAQGARVSAAWLITGEGPREILKSDRYPARLKACRAAAELGLDTQWIEYAQDRATFVDGFFEPPTPLWWFDWIYASHRAGRPARLQAVLAPAMIETTAPETPCQDAPVDPATTVKQLPAPVKPQGKRSKPQR